jgi:hypothetical protein
MPYWTNAAAALPLAIRDRFRDLLEADTVALAAWAAAPGRVGALTVNPLPSPNPGTDWRISLYFDALATASIESDYSRKSNVFVLTVARYMGDDPTALDADYHDSVLQLAWLLSERFTCAWISEPTEPTGYPARPALADAEYRLWSTLRLDRLTPVLDVQKRTGESGAWEASFRFVTETDCLLCGCE